MIDGDFVGWVRRGLVGRGCVGVEEKRNGGATLLSRLVVKVGVGLLNGMRFIVRSFL